MEQFKLSGFISGDTFASNGNSHFSDENGNVICGSVNRFGFDCSVEIKFHDIDNFETDYTKSFQNNTGINLRTNHLPLPCFITCKKCQKKLTKILNKC